MSDSRVTYKIVLVVRTSNGPCHMDMVVTDAPDKESASIAALQQACSTFDEAGNQFVISGDTAVRASAVEIVGISSISTHYEEHIETTAAGSTERVV